MRNISISDEKGNINLFRGKTLDDDDMESIQRILYGLYDKINKLENRAPTPEGTRLIILEYSHYTLWKAQVETSKVLEELKEEVATLSLSQNFYQKSHARQYKEMCEYGKAIKQLQYLYTKDIEGQKRQDKRLSDIEEFLGDI